MHGLGLKTGIDNPARIARALTHAQVTDLLAVAALCGAADGGAPSSRRRGGAPVPVRARRLASILGMDDEPQAVFVGLTRGPGPCSRFLGVLTGVSVITRKLRRGRCG